MLHSPLSSWSLLYSRQQYLCESEEFRVYMFDPAQFRLRFVVSCAIFGRKSFGRTYNDSVHILFEA